MSSLKPSTFSFRRVIDIAMHGTSNDGVVKVALEDDYHHFRVCVRFHNQVITQVQSQAIRTPYTLCSDAGAQLDRLEGVKVQGVAAAINGYTNATLHCTHQLNMTGLALAAASRNSARRRYEIQVAWHEQGVSEPRLIRDGELVLCWSVENNVIVNPAPFIGRSLGRGFSRWAIENFEVDLSESIIVLQHGTYVSQGRLLDLDLQNHAAATGYCYAQQPERAEQALRNKGSTLDFSDEPHALCASDQFWLGCDQVSVY